MQQLVAGLRLAEIVCRSVEGTVGKKIGLLAPSVGFTGIDLFRRISYNLLK